ncbi:MAG: hypothetical protein ACOC3J_05990 [Gemmatimonadota bacterium]
MTRWNPWRSALAGAVIGFIEAAGTEVQRRALNRPNPVVRYDEREPEGLRPPAGLWFLEPLRDLKRLLSPN